MADMIERVARVLCAFEGRDPDEACLGEEYAAGKTWLGWQAFTTNALQILIAMREPTDDMVDAGEDTAEGVCECMSARNAWTAMIDAALKEPIGTTGPSK